MNEMARISIYVPDDLKADMDAVGDAINWSELARPVFLSGLVDHRHRTERTDETAIARLRASKRFSRESSARGGREWGEEWARSVAEYWDLTALASIKFPTLPFEGDVFDLVHDALECGSGASYEDDWQGTLGSDEIPGRALGDQLPNRELIKTDPEYRDDHNNYVRAWVGGAVDFFNRVKDQL